MIWSEVRQAYPNRQREFYFAHTGREELDIRERRYAMQKSECRRRNDAR